MVADRAGIPLAAVPAAARLELRGGHARGRLEAARSRRGEQQAGTPGAVDRRRLPAAEQLENGVEVVDVDLARHVGAAEAELSGARNA